MNPVPANPHHDWPTCAYVETLLREALQPTRLEVIDESAAHAGHSGANGRGYGTHFRVRIAAPALRARSRVAAHRLVYDALRPAFEAGLHALALEVLPQ
ncbi:BolA family protein [Tepidimonas sp.]|uniref:BolA family protein n=1 Tax=Tepidimonas sp. TaxID=2002775 RepID=UPI002FE3F1AC